MTFKIGYNILAKNNLLGVTNGKIYTLIEGRTQDFAIIDDDDNFHNMSNEFLKNNFEIIRNEFIFENGDIVDFGGIKGTIKVINDSLMTFVFADKKELYSHEFYRNGTLYKDQTKSLLELIERPKKKVKRNILHSIYYSPSLDKSFDKSSIQLPGDCILIDLSKEIEVEI